MKSLVCICVATLMPLNVKLSPVAKLIVSPDELLIRDCISEALKPKSATLTKS